MSRCSIPVSALCLLALIFAACSGAFNDTADSTNSPRARLSINGDWRFIKGDPPDIQTDLSYNAVKTWILPTGNNFLVDPAKWHKRPDGNFGDNVAYVTSDFDDSSWRQVDLPHDYAIESPFTDEVGGSMGRLPSPETVGNRSLP